MQRTQNYNLCQWAAEDRILRSDFNADNQKIDAAVAEKARIVTGTYVGDGAETRTISLGFTPSAVLVMDQKRLLMSSDGYSRYGGIALTDLPAYACADNRFPVVSITDNGFIVYKDSKEYFAHTYHADSNVNQNNYLYLAVK